MTTTTTAAATRKDALLNLHNTLYKNTLYYCAMQHMLENVGMYNVLHGHTV